MKQRGFGRCLISGDHAEPTRHLAETLGIDRYFAEVLPTDKAQLVEQLADEGRTGIGVAQIVFMDGTLARLPALFDFAIEYERNLKTNQICTVAPGVINLAGVFLFGSGVATAMGIYYLGSLANLAISFAPLAKYPSQDDETAT